MQDFLGEHGVWGFLQSTRLKFKYEPQLFGQESWTSLFWTVVTCSALPTCETEIPARLMTGVWKLPARQTWVKWPIYSALRFAGGKAVLFLAPFPPSLYASFHAYTSTRVCRFESVFTIQPADPMFWWQMVKFLPSAKHRYFYESLGRGKIRKETVWDIPVIQLK